MALRTGEGSPLQRAIETSGVEIDYTLNVSASTAGGALRIEVGYRSRLVNGGFGSRKPLRYDRVDQRVPLSAEDREILALLNSFDEGPTYGDHGYYDPYHRRDNATAVLDDPSARLLIPMIARTGRLIARSDNGETYPIAWGGDEIWSFRLRVEQVDVGKNKSVAVHGTLVRSDAQLAVTKPTAFFNEGIVVYGESIARFEANGAIDWITELRHNGPLVVPAGDADHVYGCLAATAHRAWERETVVDASKIHSDESPRFAVSMIIGTKPSNWRGSLACDLTFDYGNGITIDPAAPAGLIQAADDDTWVERDIEAEAQAVQRMYDLGVQLPEIHTSDCHGEVAPSRVSKIVEGALNLGWSVKADGKVHRVSGSFSGKVQSGIDWFDLEGGLEFGDQVAPLPAILDAAREGRRQVELGDGSFGMLPESWLDSWGLLDLAGKSEGDALRFNANQGWILDALLNGRDDIESDRGFDRYRARLTSFNGIKPKREPRGFKGELRAYQRLAVGWFAFLRDLGLGGCLADDMGLGKTVQVLALLEDRRLSQKKLDGGVRPTLVVAPKSLVFNWMAEAERFAPKLNALDYTGVERKQYQENLSDFDLIVTTYGTLRRDAISLAEVDFDYVVLDEATAIKNATSQAAKAARLMKARHRVALSGTPIENHLGELWSLFEFLNPGMLGRSTAFKRFTRAGKAPEELAALSRALRPFFLRRTKSEVLKDLPEKTEQVVMCELGKAERKRYNEVRDHFRAELLGGNSGASLGRAKILVLEALLRLRQCACHPALLDESLEAESSAKLDELVPRLQELSGEGHKILVFSQFTSFLKVLRTKLDALGLTYEYLDGATRKRKQKVERFQADKDCPLFLISIKAGGHGLNLTAADYVFIMDPWWNPAVEAQAVDRAHRMGQTKPVFAYRLIAKDTVEEKVLQLQGDKRELAEAVLSEGSTVLRDLTRDDLETLLS